MEELNYILIVLKRQKSISGLFLLITYLVLVLIDLPCCLSSYSSDRDRHSKVSKDPASFICEADIKNCIEPVTSKLCSGKGACVCGSCACFNTEFEKYYGRFCEHCESCSLNLCGLLQPCVECKVHNSGPFATTNQDCDANCSRFPLIQIAEVSSSDEKVDHFFCTFKDADDCEFYFIYGYDAAGHLVIIAQREKECPIRVRTSSSSNTGPHRQEQLPNSGKKLISGTVPPVLKELPNTVQINDFDSPMENGGHQSGIAARYNDESEDNGGSSTPIKTRKKLNTEAFDLMIVCGLSMTRSSGETSQQPQYFQRNGIHFDVKNCQFIPNSEHFIFTSGGGLQDITNSSNSLHNIFTNSSQLILFMSILFSFFYYN